MYADGTTLYCNINQQTTENDINIELIKIKHWLSANKLSLNVAKTKFMVFHTIQKNVQYPIIRIDNNIIEQVQKFNFLGLIINSHLTWQNHIDHIANTISRVIGVMYRLKHIYPKSILLMLYNTLIVPHFTYCLLVWGSKINDGHRLHLVQKRALRTIVNEDYIAHSEPICKTLRLLKVTDMFRLAILKFYYKLMSNKLPSYFETMKPVLPRICNYHEIRRPTFHLPYIRHSFSEQLVEYQLIKILNDTTFLITSKVHTHSFQGFKRYIKNNVIDSYSLYCTILNCYACKRRRRHISE